ncbi:MAG: hypothetical protein J0L53_18405 [Spirochaetes bacterium]|nr:hypothetical protein [Spirochaetota bacterium]
MNETDFQALFDSYSEALRSKSDNPIPQKLHLMIYNYARLRHQQTSDVSADFYLHICGKLEGIFARYDPRRIPFYQYLASMLNFEFSHFLRRRRLPRSQLQLLSLDELQARNVQLGDRPADQNDELGEIIKMMKTGERQYAKLALALPLNFGELRQLTQRKKNQPAAQWGILRSYREFLRFAEERRSRVLADRDRLAKVLTQLNHQLLSASGAELARLKSRRETAQKKFFSMDARIPIRIVAGVTGDSIATAQRQLKKAMEQLKKAWLHREKHKLGGKKRTTKEAH